MIYIILYNGKRNKRVSETFRDEGHIHEYDELLKYWNKIPSYRSREIRIWWDCGKVVKLFII